MSVIKIQVFGILLPAKPRRMKNFIPYQHVKILDISSRGILSVSLISHRALILEVTLFNTPIGSEFH